MSSSLQSTVLADGNPACTSTEVDGKGLRVTIGDLRCQLAEAVLKEQLHLQSNQPQWERHVKEVTLHQGSVAAVRYGSPTQLSCLGDLPHRHTVKQGNKLDR